MAVWMEMLLKKSCSRRARELGLCIHRTGAHRPIYRDGTIGQAQKRFGTRGQRFERDARVEARRKRMGFREESGKSRKPRRRVPWCRSFEFAANGDEKEKIWKKARSNRAAHVTIFVVGPNKRRSDESRRRVWTTAKCGRSASRSGRLWGQGNTGNLSRSLRFRGFQREFRGLSALK